MARDWNRSSVDWDAARKAQPTVDLQVSNLGTIWTFYPLTRAGTQWLETHTRGETIAEARYGWDIVQGMLNDGMVLQDARTGQLAQREN